MKKSSGLALNSLSQVGVRLGASFCALALTWLIARRSPEDLGVFRTLFVYFLMCEFVPLLGMQTYLFREISVCPEKTRAHALHALVFALAVSGLGMCGLAGVAAAGIYSENISTGLLLVAASFPPTAASLVGLSVLVGTGRTTHFSLVQGAETLVRTVLGVGLILAGANILWTLAGVIAARWLVVPAYWVCIRSVLPPGRWMFSWLEFKAFVQRVPTYAGITLLSIVTRFGAPALIPFILDDQAAGLFAAAYVFVDLALMVPTALSTNLIPVFAKRSEESVPALAQASAQGLALMATGLLPVAAIMAVISVPLFETIYPGQETYRISGIILQSLIWTCVFQAMDQILASAIIARGKPEVDLRTVLCGALILCSVLAGALLSFGVKGAGFAVALSMGLSFVVRFVLVSRHIPGIHVIDALWRPLLATALTSLATFGLSSVHWIAAAAGGAATYLGVLALLGAFRPRERQRFLGLFQARPSPS